jgi:signal transduction histidine kinase
MSEALEQKLAGKALPESAEAGRIAQRMQGAIEQTRMLARGLSPLEMESADLMTALAELASNTTEVFRVRCRFVAENPVTVTDAAACTHLYRIAQEAISNAIRHGGADEIAIVMEADEREAVLSVTDNGTGISEPKDGRQGMGLHIMKYRAGMIGGALEVGQANGKGTVVSCRFRPALVSFP